MKTQKSKWLGIFALALLLTSVNVNAQNSNERERPRGPRHEMAKGQAIDEHGKQPEGPMIPGLTEEQKEQLKGFHVAAEKTALPLKNQVAEKEARLASLTTVEDFDAKAVDKVIEEIGKLRTDLFKLRVNTDQKIRSILNDEQLVFFNSHAGQKGHPKMKGKR